MVFHGHTGLHLYPVPVFVLGKVHTLCHKTEELYICLAADHGKAAGAMGAGVLLGVAHEQLHVNGLARPAVGVVPVSYTHLIKNRKRQCQKQN